MPNKARVGEHEGLDTILVKVEHYLAGYAATNDLELLNVSLRHLFYTVDRLYTIALPELAQQAIPELHEPHSSIRKRQWLHLQEIEQLLEQMIALGQILNRTIIPLLSALNSAQAILPQQAQTTERLYAQFCLHLIQQEQGQQQWFTLINQIQGWRKGRAVTLTTQFSSQASAVFPLTQMDRALDLLLDSMLSIFKEILPTFSTLRQENTEMAIMLLLDTMQRVDILLSQSSSLLKPLHLLVKML